jgi:F-type H+-transporting ATPase subunit gamma
MIIIIKNSDFANYVFNIFHASPVEIFNTAKPAEMPKRKLFIVVSSDKGLCGGVHSGLSKLVRRTIADPNAGVDPESPIVVIGDKAKSQLSRVLSKNLILTVNQVGKDVPTFADATGIADLIFQTGAKYESVSVVQAASVVTV